MGGLQSDMHAKTQVSQGDAGVAFGWLQLPLSCLHLAPVLLWPKMRNGNLCCRALCRPAHGFWLPVLNSWKLLELSACPFSAWLVMP